MADLLNQLEPLRKGAGDAIAAAGDEKALEDLRVRYLGKKGELSAVLRGMGSLSAEERPKVGEVANRVKAEVEALLDDVVDHVVGARLDVHGSQVTVYAFMEILTFRQSHPEGIAI